MKIEKKEANNKKRRRRTFVYFLTTFMLGLLDGKSNIKT